MDTAQLKLIHSPHHTIHLPYRREPLERRQARLAGRTAVEPQIDLGGYSCRAVIDWVDLEFHLSRRTQFQWVQQAITELVCRRPYVEMTDPGPGNVSDVCRVRIQEPRTRVLRSVAARIEEQFGLVGEVRVEALEVSVDFTPKHNTKDTRLLMVGVLSRHLLPGRDVISNRLDRPRCAWGSGSNCARQFFPYSDDPIRDNTMLMSDAYDRALPIDTTFYLGARGSCESWRVMEKTIDTQNRSAGTFVMLDEKKRRARVEVTIAGSRLQDLGIQTINDLVGFRYNTLQGRYFAFMLPTFGAGEHCVTEELERRRLNRFMNGGVVGLLAKDEATRAFLEPHRKQLRLHIRAAGRSTSRSPRLGNGPHGTFVAYQKLNRKVETALRRLMGRER